MARRPRVLLPGLLNHVIVRGNRRQKTFLSNQDYQAYLERLAKYCKLYEVIVYAYCLMPNHVHLLLECSGSPLSRFMQGLQQTYTHYFNRTHRKVGHLFQGRYKALICEKDSYLLELVRYIHLNPVRSKLVQRPEQYRYSGHRLYLKQTATEFLQPGPVLKLLGGLNGYKRFVLDGLKQEHNEEYYAVQEQRFLGTEEFGQKVKEKAHEDSRTQGKALAAVVEELARRLKVGVDSLQGPDRSWKVSRLRGLVVYVLTRRLGYPVREVAQCFGRDATSISVLANRVSARIEQHPAIRGECENLVKFV